MHIVTFTLVKNGSYQTRTFSYLSEAEDFFKGCIEDQCPSVVLRFHGKAGVETLKRFNISRLNRKLNDLDNI